MTGRLPLLAFTALLVTGIAAGVGVDLDIDREQQAEIVIVDSDTPANATKTWTVEAENTGSAAFSGRIRMDIVAGNATVFRAWSAPLTLEPGTAAARTMAFHAPDRNGSLAAEFRLHHGVEVAGPVTDRFRTTVRNTSTGFGVVAARAYGDAVSLAVRMPAEVETAYVSLDGGAVHRFAQQAVAGRTARYVRVPSHPAMGADRTVTVTITDSAGRYKYTEEVAVDRVSGMAATVWPAMEAIAAAFHVFLI